MKITITDMEKKEVVCQKAVKDIPDKITQKILDYQSDLMVAQGIAANFAEIYENVNSKYKDKWAVYLMAYFRNENVIKNKMIKKMIEKMFAYYWHKCDMETRESK